MLVGRSKFLIGGLVILAAVVYLIVSSTKNSVEYFMTVNELLEGESAFSGKSLRISGAVIGDTIHFNPDTMNLTFEIANIPGDNAEIEANGGLAKVLHEAVNDPSQARLMVSYQGVMPDLLQDEAQAIITGHMGEDDIFYANELLLKCPTRYEETIPEQASGN